MFQYFVDSECKYFHPQVLKKNTVLFFYIDFKLLSKYVFINFYNQQFDSIIEVHNLQPSRTALWLCYVISGLSISSHRFGSVFFEQPKCTCDLQLIISVFYFVLFYFSSFFLLDHS